MKTKKILLHSILLLFIFSATIFTSSCTNEDPKKIVEAYLTSLVKGEYENSYKLLSEKDREIKTESEYVSDLKLSQGLVTPLLLEKMRFEIKDQNIKDDTATVLVETALLDVTPIIQQLFDNLFSAPLLDSNEIEEKIKEEIKNDTLSYEKTETTFNLVKDKNEWRIFLNYEKKERINQLETKLNSMYDTSSLEEILSVNEELYSLDQTEERKETIDTLKEKINKEKEKVAYIENNIEVYNLNTKMYDTFTKGKVPGVTFALKNKGDKTLSLVEVTVFFEDESSTVISENAFYPITTYTSPLKPNYSWEMGSNEYFEASHIPSSWKEGKATCMVTKIEF